MAGYAKSPGNNGVWMLRRDVDDRTEFVMFTLWDSLEAVKAFAGDDHETAVFYPEGERFLVQRDLTTAHYEVDTHVGPDVADRSAPLDAKARLPVFRKGFRSSGRRWIVVVGSALPAK